MYKLNKMVKPKQGVCNKFIRQTALYPVKNQQSKETL